MKTESLAILLTDIKGFTARTSTQSREENERWLARHTGLVLPIVSAFGGVERNRIGDALLLSFASPTNAVLCATAIQDRLWAYNRVVGDEERLHLRAALSMGEVRVDKNAVLGAAVTEVGAMESSVDAGEVWFTEALYLSMTKAEIGAEEVGLRRLEGLSEPVKLYRVVRGSGDAAPPFGNGALDLVPSLPTIDEGYLRRLREGRLESLSKAVAAAASTGGDIARGIRGWIVGAGVGGLVIAGLVFAGVASVLWSSPVDEVLGLVDDDRIEEARSRIEAYRGEHPDRRGDVAFMRGYVAHHRDRIPAAAQHYTRAVAKQPGDYRGHSMIYEHMVEALRHENCSARTAAARTLGALGDDDAVDELQDAIEAESSAGGFARLAGLLCRFVSTAEAAITVLND